MPLLLWYIVEGFGVIVMVSECATLQPVLVLPSSLLSAQVGRRREKS